MCTVNCRPTASNYQLSHLRPSRGSNPRPQRWEARVLPLCHHGPQLAVQENSNFQGNKTKLGILWGIVLTLGEIVTRDSPHTHDQTAKSGHKVPCRSVPWLGNCFSSYMSCHDAVNNSQDYKLHPAGADTVTQPQLTVQKVSQGIKTKLGLWPIEVWVPLSPESIYDILYIYLSTTLLSKLFNQ